jgi:uncharacterized protein (TIGR03067 family)
MTPSRTKGAPMRLLLLTAVALTLALAPAPFPRAGRPVRRPTDLERLQGTWAVLECRDDGQPSDPSDVRIVIEQGRWKYVFKGKVQTEWEIKVDAAATPRGIDRKSVQDDRFLWGIYHLDGDRLLVASCRLGQRPERLASDDGVSLMVLQRARD